MQRIAKLALVILFAYASFPVAVSANPLNINGTSLAGGYGVAHISPIRIGLQSSWDKQWLTNWQWPLSGYWEASFYHMPGSAGIEPNSNSKISAIAFAPVFRFSKATTAKFQPYIEVAVGISQMNKREIGGRDLGIHFQFEDRFGIGYRFGYNKRAEIGYKAIHFSNAYIGPKNHGINLHVLMFGYWFG